MNVNKRFSKLLEPGYIGKVKIRNRIIKTGRVHLLLRPLVMLVNRLKPITKISPKAEWDWLLWNLVPSNSLWASIIFQYSFTLMMTNIFRAMVNSLMPSTNMVAPFFSRFTMPVPGILRVCCLNEIPKALPL